MSQTLSDLETEAKQHIKKAEQTVEFLTSKLSDPNTDDRRKAWLKRDIAATKFLLQYAREALQNRGVEV